MTGNPNSHIGGVAGRAIEKVICPRCKAKPGKPCTTTYRPETWSAPVTYPTYRPHVERTRALRKVEVREAAKQQGITQKELMRRVGVENARPPFDTDMRLARHSLRQWDREEDATLAAWLVQHGDVLWEEPSEARAGEAAVPLREDDVPLPEDGG